MYAVDRSESESEFGKTSYGAIAKKQTRITKWDPVKEQLTVYAEDVAKVLTL